MGMCDHEGRSDRQKVEIVTVDDDVSEQLQLAADGSDLTEEEIAQRYLRYGAKYHENAVYGGP